MKELLLSIIIPVYNVEKYIRPCLESVFNQGLAEDEFEIILVDDGCTDNTLHIVESFLTKNKNTRIVHQKNLGPASARNNGMRNAKGKFILFVDSDDLLIEQSLRNLLNIASEHSLDILKSQIVTIDNREVEKGNFPKTVQWDNRIGKVVDGESGFISSYNPDGSYVFMNLFRREFLLENNLWFIEGIFFMEDVAFTVSGYLKAKRFMEVAYTNYIYRRNEASIMSTMSKRKLFDANTVISELVRMKENMKFSAEGLMKMNGTIFSCFTVMMWYLSHYKSLYPQRREVIADLKKKCPDLSFNGNIKQRITTFFYKYMPSLYLSFRYFTAKRKYNQ